MALRIRALSTVGILFMANLTRRDCPDAIALSVDIYAVGVVYYGMITSISHDLRNAMTSDPKTKPEDQETVGDETSDDPKSGELTLEELASVSGGDGSNEDDPVFSGYSQGPDWSNDG